MIQRPDEFIPAFATAGADWISFTRKLAYISIAPFTSLRHGFKPGVVINPATPLHTLDEVLHLVRHVYSS
jgi:ribulose-phosphate 3-epimerase